MSTASLPASFRLKRAADFLVLKQSGQRTTNSCFTALELDNGLKHFKIGIIVSKKVSKKATARNKIKRQIREFFRNNKSKIPNRDFLIIAKQKCLDTETSQIHKNLGLLFKFSS